MTDTYLLSDYLSCIADCADGMTGTDNTAAINAVIASLPSGSRLVVTPSTVVQGGDGVGYGHAGPIVVDHPVSIIGRSGMYSRLCPLAGFNPAAPNIHIIENSYYWEGIKFGGFQIGGSIFNPPFFRNGGDGIFVDGVSVTSMIWEDLLIGESGNGYGLHITGVGTQHHRVVGGEICGVFFDGIADGHSVTGTRLPGRTRKSGLLVNMFGGNFALRDCPSITAVGGVVIGGGTMPVIEGNYCEELPGYPIDNYALAGGYSGMISFVGYPGNVYAGRIRDNIINMGVSGPGNGFNTPGATAFCINLNPAVHGAAHTHISGNEFNLSTNRGYINSQDPDLCLGPNTAVSPGWSTLSGMSSPATHTY